MSLTSATTYFTLDILKFFLLELQSLISAPAPLTHTAGVSSETAELPEQVQIFWSTLSKLVQKPEPGAAQRYRVKKNLPSAKPHFHLPHQKAELRRTPPPPELSVQRFESD
ncbi:hypothetical protein Q7C36_020528 [Tachysurus vachellii]|uniref:Uncharacterized protein n=1 Tax=Tachysurus vachellii TaxID=175792 RepID=A0AA88LP78_TACVA|nr:hypothetical protein Q7C36_020528 [Tachysurus vachellii]